MGRVEDYQQSRFYEKSLELCPWRNTDHLGERRGWRRVDVGWQGAS